MSGNTEKKGRVEQEFVNGNLLNLYHQEVRMGCLEADMQEDRMITTTHH